MQWADVLQEPSLQDLPYKIELNQWGQVVMSPASNRHANYQSRVNRMMGNALDSGDLFTECSIETDAGVKVADVAWCSNAFLEKHGFETPFTEAPEICVEILSPSNTDRQMQEKMALYFRRGAVECWLVRETGEVRFFDRDGEKKGSRWPVDLSLLTKGVPLGGKIK